MEDTVYTLEVSFKAEEHVPNVVPLGKSIKSAIMGATGNPTTLTVASKEDSQHTRAQTAYFRLKVTNVYTEPVDQYEKIRDAVIEEHNQDIIGWGFSVSGEYTVAEKENETND